MKSFKFFNINHIVTTDDIRDFLMSTISPYIVLSGEIDAYRQGIDAAMTSTGQNPYPDAIRGEIWVRGFWDATNLIYKVNEII